MDQNVEKIQSISEGSIEVDKTVHDQGVDSNSETISFSKL